MNADFIDARCGNCAKRTECRPADFDKCLSETKKSLSRNRRRIVKGIDMYRGVMPVSVPDSYADAQIALALQENQA